MSCRLPLALERLLVLSALLTANLVVSGTLISYTQNEDSTMDADENMQLMQTLDDAWNTQDWDTFRERHAEDVVVYG